VSTFLLAGRKRGKKLGIFCQTLPIALIEWASNTLLSLWPALWRDKIAKIHSNNICIEKFLGLRT
jgi:hypothetical protein